jgi:hypothetical protein
MIRTGWPLAGVVLTFAVGLLFAGFGGAAVAGLLSVLVFGPAYLIQSSIRRRSWALPPTPPKSPVEKAQSDALFMRVMAIADVVIAIAGVVVAASSLRQWLPDGRPSTAVLLLGAALAVTSAPTLWAMAERRVTGRSLRWAWALAGACGVAFGITAAIIGVGNQRNHWIGGSAWTVALAALALLWLVGALGDLARVRR